MFQKRWQTILFSDLGILILLALSRIILHLLTNQQYGFHRDELAFLDDSRHLARGYVAYPPLTPFIGRIALELFGASTVGGRFLSSLAQGAALVLIGLITRELGSKRWAVIVAGLAVWIAPVSFIQGALFQYVSFDYLWWVLSAYCMVRLVKSENPRWWLGIGGANGLGMMTKYTMGFFALGIAGAVLLTPARRYLRSKWLWAGAGLAVLVFLPNLIWQIQHNFISLQQLSAIHIHDMSIGRTDNFLMEKFLLGANPLTFPLWLGGLYFTFFTRSGRPYRVLGWMYLITLLAFFAAQGRGYYLALAYPMLLAAGAASGERWLAKRKTWLARAIKGLSYAAVTIGAALIIAIALPAAPVNSAWWNFSSGAKIRM